MFMLSVKQRLKNISQPDGGYVPKNLFVEHQYRNFTGITEIETAFSSIQGLTVDYLTRYMLSNDKLLAFGKALLSSYEIKDFNTGQAIKTRKWKKEIE